MISPSKIVIEVEQRHIDEGVGGNCRLCPLAVALQEQYSELIADKGGDFVVGVNSIFIGKNDGQFHNDVKYILSKEGRQFTYDFDVYREASPCRIEATLED